MTQFVNPVGQVYNIGPDASVTIIRQNDGAQISLDGKRRSFSYKQEMTVINDEPIDNGGIVTLRTLPKTWGGTIEVERSQGYMSSEMAANDAAFFEGDPQAYYTITVTEPNGDHTATLRTQFLGTVLHDYDVGPYERETTVRVRVQFRASQRVVLGG